MGGALHCGMDIGSTTCKYVLCGDDGEVIASRYERHGSRQAEKALELLARLEEEHGFRAGRDRIDFTGSGAGTVAPRAGGRVFQEVVAVAAAVERLHPRVRFVSEIGGEDMKTIFFTGEEGGGAKQVLMQNACSGGTGAFIEKTARKLGVAEALGSMTYAGRALHRLSSKCGIFAEADANTLVKAGVPVEEIIASLFEAVVSQNLSTLTRGCTPRPEALLLGGPNLFFPGLQEAWRAHLARLWAERGLELPAGRAPDDLVVVPRDALYYAALGCVEIARREGGGCPYRGREELAWWVGEGQAEEKRRSGASGLWSTPADLEGFLREYGPRADGPSARRPAGTSRAPYALGLDLGSTTAKAVCLSAEGEVEHSSYVPSRGNPLEDVKALLPGVREAMGEEVLGVGLTGYGAPLLREVLGADAPVVETVAHATAALRWFPEADCICDVGGVDVKILLLRNGSVCDFRLNSQCSSGNGAFLQGVAERFDIPLGEIAGRAFRARWSPAWPWAAACSSRATL